MRIGLIFILLGFSFLTSTGRAQTKQSSLKVALVQAQLAWGNVDANLEAFDRRAQTVT